MALFDYIGEGWTLIGALELHREISGPDSQTSYQTEPLRVVPCDLALRWGLLIVSLLDETANFVFRKPEWRKGRKRPSWIIYPWAPLRLVSGNDADIGENAPDVDSEAASQEMDWLEAMRPD